MNVVEHEVGGDQAEDAVPLVPAAGHQTSGPTSESPHELDLLRGEVAVLEAKLDLVLAQLEQARYNTELAVQEREQLVKTLNRLGFARAKQAVQAARRLRDRVRRRRKAGDAS